MKYILHILLISTAFVLVISENAISCQNNNCTSTETDSNSSDESDVQLFSPDPGLRELYLDDCNNLIVLELTPNLSTLEINNCFWLRFEMTKLGTVGNLSSLHFRNGTLWRLARNMFVQLPQLEILGLGRNNIAIVSADAFIGLTQLWMLDLNGNRIIFFEKRIFHPLVNLRHLDLSGNALFKLPDAIFDKNPVLQVLFLNGNHLSSLYPYTLAILKNLLLLDLSNNFIYELQLLRAETIILDNSGVHRMEILGNVSKFQARNNFLEYLHFEEQISVTELDLHGNKLTTEDMSNILKGMWRLQRLDLSSNLAKKLPTLVPSMLDEKEVYHLPSLRFLNISKNMLEHLNGDSPLLSPSLTHLDVSYNKICEMDPNIFSLFNSLQILHIEGNRLDHFRYDLFHIQQQGLKEVALYDNEFSYDSYMQITSYFKSVGVHVLKEDHWEELTSVGKESSMEKCVRSETDDDNLTLSSHSEEQIDVRTSREFEHQKLNTFRKWSSWKILILLILSAALSSNVILVIQLRRSRGRRGNFL
ncbi:hypothetical protein KR054_006787 [Drosophila jambulina]|nr:hypothetical protein KR054_006787 [Drosophila jambulina]